MDEATKLVGKAAGETAVEVADKKLGKEMGQATQTGIYTVGNAYSAQSNFN